MRLLIIILLFSLNAQGQIINASSPYRPFASVSLLLDTYTGAAAAYSLRKLRNAYSGSAIRVRRSNDNAESDIGFVGNNLDTTSLKTFVGSNNGFVTTWYDQSGNGRNATQSTAANQPSIVTSGTVLRQGVNPSISFNGVTSRMMYDAAGSVAQPITTFGVYIKSSSPTTRGDFLQVRDNSLAANVQAATLSYSNNNTTFGTFSGTVLSATATVTNLFLGTVLVNSTNSFIWFNSSQIANGNAGSRAGGFRYLFGHDLDGFGVPVNYLTGSISEIIIYNSNQSSNRTGIESNINSYYSIY